LVATRATAAAVGRDVPVREHILGVDSNLVLSFFEVVVCSVEFWEYVLIYYHALKPMLMALFFSFFVLLLKNNFIGH
jgi:hypothetical protein